jgi:hypothetical protein
VDEIQIGFADKVFRIFRAGEPCPRGVNEQDLLFVEDGYRFGEVFYQPTIALFTLLEGILGPFVPTERLFAYIG